MKYNIDYLELNYSLIKELMFDANPDILDISYERNDNKLRLQIVILFGTIIDRVEQAIRSNLSQFEITIDKVYLTKNQFNENIGDWAPKYYEWLDHVLFSKAEIL